MTLEFIKQINEHIIDATLEADDEEILSRVGSAGYPTMDDIRRARSDIDLAVKARQQKRLAQKRAEFEAHKQLQAQRRTLPVKRSVSDMLIDIVSTIQNKDQVPDGILIAFRDQGQNGSEDDIKEIWESLVQLGLIDPSDSDEQS